MSLLRSCLTLRYSKHKKYSTVSFTKERIETLMSITNRLSSQSTAWTRSQRKDAKKEVYESPNKANKSFSAWVSRPQSVHQMQPDGWVYLSQTANRDCSAFGPTHSQDRALVFSPSSFLQMHYMCPTQYFNFFAFQYYH